MVSVFYQILYWLKSLMDLILTVWLESVKNVKISPVIMSCYTVLIPVFHSITPSFDYPDYQYIQLNLLTIETMLLSRLPLPINTMSLDHLISDVTIVTTITIPYHFKLINTLFQCLVL